MEATLGEYARHIAKAEPIYWVAGFPWVRRNRVLRPLAMPHQMGSISRTEARNAVKSSRALLAQWTEGWETNRCDWWYICCDNKSYELESLRKTPRHDVRKGLENCEVRRVDGEWFAQNGYDVYRAAFQRYGTSPVLTQSEFIEEFRRHAGYAGRETWCAFVEGRLVAWESCLVIDDAAISASAKSDPAYFKARPNNALVYSLTRHYLVERGLRYVTSGARVLVHDTNVQEFQERMGYRKIYCALRTELSPVAALVAALPVSSWARKLGFATILKSRLEQLDGLSAAARISKACTAIATDISPSKQLPHPVGERKGDA